MIFSPEKKHARLSPSASSRWTKCPASVLYTDEYGSSEANEASAKGTVFHWIMEQCLKDESEPDIYVDKTFKEGEFSITITEKDCEILKRGLLMIDEIPGRIFIEKRVKLDRWLEGQFGTMDVGIIGKRRITVIDHKFGVVPVHPENNPQLMTYALGFWDNFVRDKSDVTDFRLIIWQPFSKGGGGAWDTTLDELLEFGAMLRLTAKRILDGDTTEIANFPQCKYCAGANASGKCQTYQNFMFESVFGENSNIDLYVECDIKPVMPSEIDKYRRAWLIKHSGEIRSWLASLSSQALSDAMNGIKIPGMKVVEGRASARKWRNEDEAFEFLRSTVGESLAVKQSLISPAECENLLIKMNKRELVDQIDNHISSIQRSLVLVDESNRAPAAQTILELFNSQNGDKHG